MRILKIVSSNDGGGVLTCETQFIKCMRSQGIVVDLIIIGNGKKSSFYADLVDNHIKLEDLTWSYTGGIIERIKGIIGTYKYGRHNLSKALNLLKNDYDAVLYRRPNFLFLAGFLAKEYGCKAFWHLPGIVSNKTAKIMYSFLCKKYTIIPIANSEFTRRSLGEVCKYFVYPGFDHRRITLGQTTYREKLNIPDSAPVYGMVARVCYDKAQDLLIEGFIKSQALAEGGHLLIAGNANDSLFLEKLRQLSGVYLEKNIHFLGEITNLSEFYSTIDIAINSRRNEEAFGISVAEALGSGKPIIAYKLGGPSEMIVNNVNGWLIDSSNAESYSNAFNLSIDKRSEWEQMGHAGKLRSEIFSVDYNVKKLVNIINTNH